MAVTGACIFAGGMLPISHQEMMSPSAGKTTRRFAMSTGQLAMSNSAVTMTSSSTVKGPRVGEAESTNRTLSRSSWIESEDSEMEKRKSLRDYVEEAKDLMKSDGSHGQPRWFTPLDCPTPDINSPLLLYLPGIDGVGLGLIRHHHKLGKIFDVWCLHIPVEDRTSFIGLVKQVERTVKSESQRSPNRPIYLVGESLGACLALAVAALNPDIDLVLILANSATSFNESYLQTLLPLFEIMPKQLLGFPYMLDAMTGDPLRMMMERILPQVVGEKLSQDICAISSYLSVLADVLPRETLVWKLRMLKSGSEFANSCLPAVKAQTLILSSGRDLLLPSEQEGLKLRRALPKSEIRRFNDKGHFLLLEDGVDLVTTIKGARFYRRSKVPDCASDYLPPSPSEFKQIYNSFKWYIDGVSPVMFSTFSDGKIVRGLGGIPAEGPVLYVGYHTLMGLDMPPMICQFLLERNISVRGIAHPLVFAQHNKEYTNDMQEFDLFRIMGAVPVSGMNMYKLLSSKSHVLMYPGGIREACHRRGEEYKIFWPEQAEFVRMAARCGAKIIPFGVVGEDDIAEIIFDANDQMKVPFLRDYYKRSTEGLVTLRTDATGEVANQVAIMPISLPKLPGRFYFYFGKPIETEGREEIKRDREKAHEVYLQVKSEVEKCLAFLKEKREQDPYRSLLSRVIYQAVHGFTSEIPTFEI